MSLRKVSAYETMTLDLGLVLDFGILCHYFDLAFITIGFHNRRPSYTSPSIQEAHKLLFIKLLTLVCKYITII